MLRIPRLGDWNDDPPVVVEGVSRPRPEEGPRPHPGTALAGELGNHVVSGHRTTYGAPFNRLDELEPGDAVVVETRDTWFTYRVTGTQVVQPTAVEVTFPVPGDRDATPTKRLLTLTTCNPKYSARQRLIVSAELDADDEGGRRPAAGARDGGLRCTAGCGAPCPAGCPASCSARCCWRRPSSLLLFFVVFPARRAAAALRRRHRGQR